MVPSPTHFYSDGAVCRVGGVFSWTTIRGAVSCPACLAVLGMSDTEIERRREAIASRLVARIQGWAETA
jgi:hypothetical protein